MCSVTIIILLGQDNPEQCKWKGQIIEISCFFINRKKKQFILSILIIKNSNWF
jgi:hypothetical protein